MSQTKRVFESAFIPYYTHAPVKVRKQSKVCLHKGIKMTDKKPRCRCKFCGWNYQDTCCCPNPITPNPIQGQDYKKAKEHIAQLEKEVALLQDVEVHLQVCENNKKALVDICEQYKQKEAKFEKELKTARARIKELENPEPGPLWKAGRDK